MKNSGEDNTSVTKSLRRVRKRRKRPQRMPAQPAAKITDSPAHTNTATSRPDKEKQAARKARIGSLQRKVLAGTITAAEDSELVYLVHTSKAPDTATNRRGARKPLPTKTRITRRSPVADSVKKKRQAIKPLTEPLLIQARAAGVVAARCPTSGMLTRNGVRAAMRECWKTLADKEREQLRQDLHARGYLRAGGTTITALTNFVTHELEKLGFLATGRVPGFGARTVSGGLPGFGRRA